MSKRIVCIDNDYFCGLVEYLKNNNANLLPYLNKKVRRTPFTRPYICLDYSKHFAYIVCYPLSSYKSTDNLQALRNRYIVIDKKIKAKIVLNAGIIVPRSKTYCINVSKNAINLHNKHYKDWLIDVKNELIFCSKNYKLIKNQIKQYVIEAKKNPTKFKLIDNNLNKEFNKQFNKLNSYQINC